MAPLLAGAPGAVVLVPGGMPLGGGGICVAGAAAGSPGAVTAGELTPLGGGGGFWPNEVSAKVREQTEIVSSVFIGLRESL